MGVSVAEVRKETVGMGSVRGSEEGNSGCGG